MPEPEPPGTPEVRAIEEQVREGVLRSIREKHPDAREVSFSDLRRDGDVWTVAGTWPLPAADSDREPRYGRFRGTVKVGPGSRPGMVAFDLSLEIFVPFVDIETGGAGGGSRTASGRSPNDQRSDAHNPTSSEYRAAANNRSNQMNPNNPSYHRSRGRK